MHSRKIRKRDGKKKKKEEKICKKKKKEEKICKKEEERRKIWKKEEQLGIQGHLRTGFVERYLLSEPVLECILADP